MRRCNRPGALGHVEGAASPCLAETRGSDVVPTVDGCDSTPFRDDPSHEPVIDDRYGAERPLDPTGGSAGQTAQNR